MIKDQARRVMDIMLLNESEYGDRHKKLGNTMFRMRTQEGLPLEFMQMYLRQNGFDEGLIRAATVVFYQEETGHKLRGADFENLTKTQKGIQKKNTKQILELYS